MRKEEFEERRDQLILENDWDNLDYLCRKYEYDCSTRGDVDGQAEAIDSQIFAQERLGHENPKEIFRKLFQLRKIHFNDSTEAYAKTLVRKAVSWSYEINAAIDCLQEACSIYDMLISHNEGAYYADREEAIGQLGLMYCLKGCGDKPSAADNMAGIHYTQMALDMASRERDCDFRMGIYHRRLGIAHLCMENTEIARDCLQKAIECFTRANEYDPDLEVYREVTDSCNQLLAECDQRTYPNEFYQQWLFG